MEERPRSERPDTDDRVDPTEGVRLIGADEAAEALERGEVAPRRGGELPRYGDRPSSAGDAERPALRFPLGRDESAAELTRPKVSAPSPLSAREAVGSVSRRWSTDDPEAEELDEVDIDLRDDGGDHLVDRDRGWSDRSITSPRWREQPLDLDLDDADLEDVPPPPDEETTVKSLDEPNEPNEPLADDAETPAASDDATTAGRPSTSEPDVDAGAPTEAVEAVGAEAVAPPTTPVSEPSGTAPSDDVRAVSAKHAAPGPDGPTEVAAGTGKDAVPPRDVRLSIVSGVGIAAAALALFMLGEAAATVLVTVIAVVCSAELFSALRRGGYQPATLLGLVATGGLVGAAYWRGEVAIPIVLGLTVVVALLWYLIGVTRIEPTMNAGVSVLAIAYVGLLGSFATLLLRLPNGRGLLGGVIIAVVANDVCALIVGRKFGKRLVAPHISPAKTVEGLVGGGVASVVVSVLLLGSDLGPLGLHPWTMGSAVALGVVVAVMAPLGDLCESMMKRDLGIKDMSTIIPGHGGVLDRIDALLFCLPAAYYLTLVLDLV